MKNVPSYLRKKVERIEEMINEKIRCIQIETEYDKYFRTFKIKLEFIYMDVNIAIEEIIFEEAPLNYIYQIIIYYVGEEFKKLYLK